MDSLFLEASQDGAVRADNLVVHGTTYSVGDTAQDGRGHGGGGGNAESRGGGYTDSWSSANERGSSDRVYSVVLVVVELVVGGVHVAEGCGQDTVADIWSPLDDRARRGQAVAVASEGVSTAETVAGAVRRKSVSCSETHAVRTAETNSGSAIAEAIANAAAIAEAIADTAAIADTKTAVAEAAQGVSVNEASPLAEDCRAHRSSDGDGGCCGYGDGGCRGDGNRGGGGHRDCWGGVASGEIASGSVGSGGVTSGSVGSGGVASGEIASTEIASAEVTSARVRSVRPRSDDVAAAVCRAVGSGRVDGHDVSRVRVVDARVVVPGHDVRVVSDEGRVVGGAIGVADGVREALGVRVQAARAHGAPQDQRVQRQQRHSVETSHAG